MTDALAPGKDQVLQLLRARVAQIMTFQVEAGRLDLSAPLDYRAGWAIGVLARLIGIPPELRAQWGEQDDIYALGESLARWHETVTLESALTIGADQ